jgi:hypothetical protein
VVQYILLVFLVQTFGNLPHLSRCGPTSFERRFSKEFEESLHVLVKSAFYKFECLFRIIHSAHMNVCPNLHISMPHVEKLADSPVLLLPIFPLTNPGTVQGGLALSTVLEHDIRRCRGGTDDAALGHD